MRPALGLQLGQQQVITPQLQQAFRMLQLSAHDLEMEVQAALESNPMLEPDEGEGDQEGERGEGEDGENQAEPEVAANRDESEESAESPDLDLERADVIPEDLPIDTQWDDVYQAPLPPAAQEDWELPERAEGGVSLQDHLHWQLNLSALSPQKRLIAAVIIDAVNPDGMLTATVEDLATSFDPALGVGADDLAAVLGEVQQFEPPGVAARSLAECLSLQLAQMPAETPWRDEAIDLVNNHLDLLAAKDFNALKRKTRFTDAELAEVADLIALLNPRPGAAHAAEPTLYVVPDVLVRKGNGRWTVELNPDAQPRLRVNAGYAALVKRRDRSRDNQFLRDNLNEARWFLKCLQSRHDTLLLVATKIVEFQQGFLERGEEAMKPLVLRDIATALDLHDSTVSRATSRKYMHTPRGVFELKYFFSSRVGTAGGGEVSSTAIRALIKDLTAEENPRKPLSDSRITAILAEHNINVARRTVAKYRESMAIPPSGKRKRLA